MNVLRANGVIQQLVNMGVEDFVLCPGARNAPFVEILSHQKDLNVIHMFNENSAGFFALGRMKSTDKPVAVITTSGTAVAELLPAMVEAYYSNLPLVVISADRPKSYRSSGAPQSIEQVGLFSKYAENVFDLEGDSSLELFRSYERTHINICFDEPLVDVDLKEQKIDFLTTSEKPNVDNQNSEEKPDLKLICTESERIQNFMKMSQSPLIVLGSLTTKEAEEVLPRLAKLQIPIYAEAHSQLKNNTDLKHLMLGGEFLTKQSFKKYFDGVIRVGSVPTLRLWRDLENKLSEIPVLSFSNTKFSGLPRDKSSPLPLDKFECLLSDGFQNQLEAHVLEKTHHDLSDLLEKYPQSETTMLSDMQKLISPGDQVFIGNSLAIREWDLLPGALSVETFSNRGANGIDGLVSTALGVGQKGKNTWCILGDLSALYDLSSLWALNKSNAKSFQLVVINNGGGKIFNRIFSNRDFENLHNIEFSGWAKMFGLEYKKITHSKDLPQETTKSTIWELVPEDLQNTKFWESYDLLCQKY